MNDELLLRTANEALLRAYVPYSQFRVGAALLDTDGRVFAGCNVENRSFGLTMCAERVAIGAAITAGSTAFEVIAIVTGAGEPTVPCGACRQVLAEFNPSLRVIAATHHGKRDEFQLDTLFPLPNRGIDLRSA